MTRPDVCIPSAAGAIFGDRLELAIGYVHLLRTAGVTRGLLGPRESDRIWERHILNSAALAEVVPAGATVVDLGSGAGLPGIPLWLARPDLEITLVEPMQRRATFLREVVERLDLAVAVVNARAEDLTGRGADVVVVRALAPMERLIPMALPVLRPGGRLLALKGRTAEAEIGKAATVLRGWPGARITRIEVGGADMMATVVQVERGSSTEARGR